MLEAILSHLHNWFPIKGAAKDGTFVIASGRLQFDGLLNGQYFRVAGSVLNDGLHKTGDRLKDETFTGTVYPLAVPEELEDLADEIEQWIAANPPTDKIIESFGGYTYTRASGSAPGWQTAFASRFSRWKKVAE